MKKITSLLIMILLILFNASAKYKQTCGAKYLNDEGWSKEYKVDITFISGFELNEETHGFNYNPSSVYAVIFWKEDQSSVIELTTKFGCGSTVNKNCITTNPFAWFEGKDKANVTWEIFPNRYVN